MSRDSQGFTLIELIMVIMLLGIVSVVVVPRLPSLVSFEQMGFFDELVGATRYGQKLAIATNCKVQLTITSNSYALAFPDSVANCHAAVPTFSTTVPHVSDTGGYQASAPSGVATIVTPSTPATIVFDAAGAADASHTVQVGSHSFTIHAATGYVETL